MIRIPRLGPPPPMPNTAVIFDFDGTLTEHYLDFDAIRRDIGLGPGPILETVDRLDADARDRANEILHVHEQDAASNVALRTGALEVLARLKAKRWPVAILTRNTKTTLETAMSRFGLVVDATVTRDDAAIKPAPDGVYALCKQLGVPPQKSWMVGDYLFDIQAGRAAGAKTVLLVEDGQPPDYVDQADFTIGSLTDLYPILGLS